MGIPGGSQPKQQKPNFHLIPGRLRIGIPGLLNNPDLANQIVSYLVQFPGVKVSHANPITGQVLVNFDPNKTDFRLLLERLYSTAGHSPGIETYAPTPNKGGDRANQEVPTAWHAIDSTEAIRLLESSVKSGLSYHEVEKRLATFGFNELKRDKGTPYWKILSSSLDNFMTRLLFVAGGVSLLAGKKTDAAVIMAIVFIQALVESTQGYRAEKSLERLKDLAAPRATVLREEIVSRVPAKELVPGDILHLEAGDLVSADSKAIETINLTTNEACLTGESIPVIKDSQKLDEISTTIADQANMLFAGTSIIGGRATALVINTGMNTELGRIAGLLESAQKRVTNLQKQLDYLGKIITRLVAASVGTIAVINLLQGRPVSEVLSSGISLAVGAVPEGLPAILTVALSSGVQRMVKRNAVVSNISAVEILGSTTMICTDKTGTLTKNEMTVKELYIGNNFVEVTGEGYQPVGEIVFPRGQGQEKKRLLVNKTLKAAALCTNAELKLGPKGKWVITGDPTEGALLTVAAKAGLWWENLKEQFCRHQEIAFDSKRRIMTVICRLPEGGYGIYVKGAPEVLVNCCDFDPKARRNVLAANEAMAERALRVLAIAYKKLPPDIDLNQVSLESELVFCGLIGMADTPRKGVKRAIRKCQDAGIKVVMITGDHQKTAEAIANRLGIGGKGRSITGGELEQLSDVELNKQVEDIVIYSRTTPDQKLKIVRALKGRRQIVAMTGDGINDAPAIKEADIGIAMGQAGTDVTREVADITLADDNFVTIVNGIEEGRAVGINLTKSVSYILSGSLSQLLTVFATAILGLPTPLLPAQILWINLVTESLPAMALIADPPEEKLMNRPPINPEERFLWQQQGKIIFRRGIIFGLTTFSLYAAGLLWGRWPLQKARTMAFAQLVVNRVLSLLGKHRAEGANAKPIKNPLIIPAASMSTALLLTTIYLSRMRPLFATVPLNIKDWSFIVINAFLTKTIDARLGRR